MIRRMIDVCVFLNQKFDNFQIAFLRSIKSIVKSVSPLEANQTVRVSDPGFRQRKQKNKEIRTKEAIQRALSPELFDKSILARFSIKKRATSRCPCYKIFQTYYYKQQFAIKPKKNLHAKRSKEVYRFRHSID